MNNKVKVWGSLPIHLPPDVMPKVERAAPHLMFRPSPCPIHYDGHLATMPSA